MVDAVVEDDLGIQGSGYREVDAAGAATVVVDGEGVGGRQIHGG